MSAADFLKYTRPAIPAAEGRSDLTHSHPIPRSDHHPPHPDRWDLERLSRSAPSTQLYYRGRDMSLEFSGTHAPQGMYAQDLDLNSLQSVESGSQHHPGGGLSNNGFDHTEGLDVPEHPGFDLFANSPPNSFGSHRYRTNASSSSSLGPNYSMGGGEPAYSHSYADPVPSYSGGNLYEMGHTLPSSYGGAKISALTPNDPIQQPSLFPAQSSIGGKDFSPQNGYHNLIQDRRTSNLSNYGSDYPEEFTMDGANNHQSGMSYSHPNAQQYQERLGRFQPDNHFPQTSGSPTVPSHLHHHHGSDVLRSVAPQSTHSYQSDIPGFDDMHPYMGSNPTGDLSLRMPGVDETLARMKLQGQTSMSSANDLHTFIRFVYDSLRENIVLIIHHFTAHF